MHNPSRRSKPVRFKHLQRLRDVLVSNGNLGILRLRLTHSARDVARARVEQRAHSDLGNVRTRNGAAAAGPA